jgi:hypothetical protein
MARIIGGWDSDPERAGCVPLSPWKMPTSHSLDVCYGLTLRRFASKKRRIRGNLIVVRIGESSVIFVVP